LKVLLVKHGYSLCSVFLRSHFNERKTARAPRGAVLHYVYRYHPACLCEVILQIVFGCGEREVPDE
jgi:hypothetical protein